MFRGIGMFLLFSCLWLSTRAQLPHPKDTLENGKKVPFNPFLGRFSVFNEGFGAGVQYSLNVGYSLLKKDLILLDLTLGANRMGFGSNLRDSKYDTYRVPIGLSMYLGRRKSRFNMRLGYNPDFYPSRYTENESSYPSLAKHSFYLSLGYTYQNQYGFFVGANAYAMMFLPSKEDVKRYGYEVAFAPWAGLVMGYRLPSKQLHREWIEKSLRGRILRLEDPKEKKPKNKKDDEVDWFNDRGELKVDSADLQEIEDRLAKLEKRYLRYQLQEKRLNGRSLVYAEFFGASGISSLNYSYTHPIAKSTIFMMEYRGGLGADQQHLQLPVHVGVKAMKNYRGTGVFLGIEPQYNWKKVSFGAIYFLEHNVEFHFAYGITGGVAFYLFYDPMFYKNYWNFTPFGGFFLGYRLPQRKQ